MERLPPVRLIRPAPGYVVGRVYHDLPFGVRQTMLDCGRAEVVEEPAEPSPPPERPAAAPPAPPPHEHRRGRR